MKTVGIFPASGGLGDSTAAHLRKLIPNDRLILVSRYPEKQPQEYAQSGVRLRKASFEASPAELEAVFKDIDVLFLISSPSRESEHRIKVHLAAAEAAIRAGVSHIFYASLAFAGPATSTSSKAEVMRAHLATEANLRSLAAANPGTFSYTSVREGLYSDTRPSVALYTGFFDPANPADEIRIPHDGKGPGIAWVRREELGEATARLIARFAGADVPGLPEGSVDMVNQTLLLTGSRAWTLQETAELLGRLVGKPVRVHEVSVDEYVSQPQVALQFASESLARNWATAFEGIKAGSAAVVTPLLEQVLGRAPEEFDVTLERLVRG